MATTPSATPAMVEAARIALESCTFPESGPDPPLLTPSQMVSIIAVVVLLGWRYTAIFIRTKADKKALAEGKEVEDDEHALKRIDARNVEFCDCGNGGPIDIWMWIITKLPCLAFALGCILPALLSYEGLRASQFSMDVDMDFAGYVKTETRMQLHEDALKQAKYCRINSIKDLKKRRRLHSLGFQDAYDLDEDMNNLHPGLFQDGVLDDVELHYNHTARSRVLAKRKGPPYWTLDIFYESAGIGDGGVSASPFGSTGKTVRKDYGVFSKTRLEEIRLFEKELLAFPGYDGHDKVDKIYDQCWRFKSSKNPCELPQSPVNIFFGSTKVNKYGNGTSGAFDGKGPLNNIESVLKTLAKEKILVFTDLQFSEKHLTSSFTRTRFRGHGPGAKKFLENLYHKLLTREQVPATQKYKSLRITWSEDSHLKNYEVMSALLHDAWYALGSFAFVAIFVLLHLRSFLLAGFAIYGILISFPAAYYFFFVTMAYRKMMILNFVSLFLIMGIGADDVFVMFDAYNQAAAALGPRSSPGQRLRWAYLEAGSAMLVTTVTTAGSFFSNCVSEVVVVRQFGFFMGAVVVLNWLHVMVIFPSFLLIYEIWWGRCWRNCCCCFHRCWPLPVFDDDDEDDEDFEDIEIDAEDTVAEIERHHAEENAERQAAQEARQKAQHERLQNRLHRRSSKSEVEKTVKVKNIPKSPVAKQAKKTGRMALVAKKKKKKKDPHKNVEVHLAEGELDLTHLGCVERCFNKCFSPFLYTLRLPLCISMLALSVGGAFLVINNFTPGDAPTIFLEDKNMGRLQRIILESGLGELSVPDERQVMSQFPSKPFTRPTCPGLLPDGLTYCNGRGTCAASKMSNTQLSNLFSCAADRNECESEEVYVASVKQMLEDFACKCETAYSGYNCSKVAIPGNLMMVRSIRGNRVGQFSTSTQVLGPEIQILIYGENENSAQEVHLVNMGDHKLTWKLAGIAPLDGTPAALPSWITVDNDRGEIPAASYLTSDGLPLPGTTKITFTVNGKGKTSNWYNGVPANSDGDIGGKYMYIQINDETKNRPAYHSNFTIIPSYKAEMTAWAPPVGQLQSFELAYDTDISDQQATATTKTKNTAVELSSTTNKLYIKKATTNWDSVNSQGVTERTVDAIIIEVEKKWDGVNKERRTLRFATANIGASSEIEIESIPSGDFSTSDSDSAKGTICKIFMTVSSNNYQSNETVIYEIKRKNPATPGITKVTSLEFTNDQVIVKFVRPNGESDKEANVNAFKPTLNVMNNEVGDTAVSIYEITTTFDLAAVPANVACSGGTDWRTQSSTDDCSIAIDLPQTGVLPADTAKRAFEVRIASTNGIKDGATSDTLFRKPKVKEVENVQKIYASVWQTTQSTKPSIPIDAITYVTHKAAIYISIEIQKINPGSHSPLSMPKCEIKKSGDGVSAGIKDCTKTTKEGTEFATVLFKTLDESSTYDIECWCDSAAGTGKLDPYNPIVSNVPSTIPELVAATAFDAGSWIETGKSPYTDFGEAASGALTEFVQAELNVKVTGVSELQVKCCTLKVTCNCVAAGQQIGEANDPSFETVPNLSVSPSVAMLLGENNFPEDGPGIFVKKIPRGTSANPSICKFSCFTELTVKSEYLAGGTNAITGLDSYTITGDNVTTTVDQTVELQPPSPPKACEAAWTNKDVITVNEANIDTWPSVYALTGVTDGTQTTATLNISDVVIPMQRDDTNGDPTMFTCELTCQNSRCQVNGEQPVVSDGWMSMDPTDTDTTPGDKIGVVFHDTSIVIGGKYTANCFSHGGGGRSDKLDPTDTTKFYAISAFTVGSSPPAPTINDVTITEISGNPRKIGFKILVQLTHHNPIVTKYTCISTPSTGTAISQTFEFTMSDSKFAEQGDNKACDVAQEVSLGSAVTQTKCALKVARSKRCASGNGQFYMIGEQCKCCTSAGSRVLVGATLYKINEIEFDAKAAFSLAISDDLTFGTVCQAHNDLGNSLDSNTISKDAFLPPQPPTAVVVTGVADGVAALSIDVTSVTSATARGGKSLTKKTCRACARFPTWCPDGRDSVTKKCCWSTSEVQVEEALSTVALTTGLTNEYEYIIECRSHHDQGTSLFKRSTDNNVNNGVIYLGAPLAVDSAGAGSGSGFIQFDSAGAGSLVYNTDNQEATLTVNIATYINNKYEGRNVLGLQCESGDVVLKKCLLPATCSNPAQISDCKGTCDYNIPTTAVATVEDAGVYVNAREGNSDPWCSLATLSKPSTWSTLGTCGFDPKRLDKNEFCFPECPAGTMPYGRVQCVENIDKTSTPFVYSYIVQNDFECKDSTFSATLDASASDCDIALALAQFVPIYADKGGVNCPLNADGLLSKGQTCFPVCKEGMVAEGNIKCSLDGTITNSFHCKRPSTIDVNPSLVIGTAYAFKCKVKNQAGWSSVYSTTQSNSVTPLSKPPLPTISSVTNGVSEQLSVVFEETSDKTDGTPYTCIATPTSGTFVNKVGLTSPIIITGLTDGADYTVKCSATNAQGTSELAVYSSGASQKVGTKPDASILTLTEDTAARVQSGDTPTTAFIKIKVTVGGTAITPPVSTLKCRACDVSDAASCVAEKSVTSESEIFEMTIDTLTAGTSYKVQCKASSDIGEQDTWTDVIASFTAKSKPGYPTNVVAVLHPSEAEQLKVTFVAPVKSGHDPITEYRCGAESGGTVTKWFSANKCTVKTGGTNNDCAAATDQTTCDAATTSGKDGSADNDCEFTIVSEVVIKNKCTVKTGGSNSDCAAATDQATCDAATTSGKAGSADNDCEFAALSAGTAVTVRCEAYNVQGWSPANPTSTSSAITPIISPSKMIIDSINWEIDEASAGTTGSMKITAHTDGAVLTYGTLDCYQCQGFDSEDTGITIVDPAAGTCDDSNGVKESMAGMVVKSLVLGEIYYFKCRARNVLGWGDWSDKSETKVSANVPLAPSVFNLISSFTTVSFKVTPISNVLTETGLAQETDADSAAYRTLKCTVYSYVDTITGTAVEKVLDKPDSMFNFSGEMYVSELTNGNLVRVKCRRKNEVGFGPLATIFSDIVVPGTVVTSTLAPVGMTSLPDQAAQEKIRRQIGTAVTDMQTGYNVVLVQPLTLTSIEFRVTVASSDAPKTKKNIDTDQENKVQEDAIIIGALPGVTSMAALVAAIESETYNSADLAVIELYEFDEETNNWKTNPAHIYKNVTIDYLTQTLFVYEAPSLKLKVKIKPHGASAVVESSSNPSYVLEPEEKDEQIFEFNKYCDTIKILSTTDCITTFKTNQEGVMVYDPLTEDDHKTDQSYVATTSIRRTAPDYENIKITVTAENNIAKQEYNIRLQFKPLKCDCNTTTEYVNPDDNSVIIVVEPAGQCNQLTGSCVCDPGYKNSPAEDGRLAGQCDSYCPNNCGNNAVQKLSHGSCGQGRCICEAGWAGDSCEELGCPICQNGGNCTGTSDVCSCPVGFIGGMCETAVCKCGKNKNGKCNTGETECICNNPKWSGSDCERYLEFTFAETLRLSFVWGFSENKRGVVVDSQGKIPVRPLLSSVPELDLSSKESQIHFLNFCQKARKETKLKVRPIEEVECWIETYALSKGVNIEKNVSVASLSNSDFPMDKTLLASDLHTFFNANNKGKLLNREDIDFTKFTSEVDIDPVKPKESKIRWVSLNINIDISSDADAAILQPIWKHWSEFVNKMNIEAPKSAGTAIMVASEFTKMDQQLALIGSTINGFMTSNLICLAAVLLFTGDLIISIYTMLAIVMIVITLLGFLFGFLGWTFGAIEAVGVTIFVGMSVDYCLHTAHGYAHSAAETRKGKVTDALTHIGVSILGAFFTTAGSTLFLFPTWIYLFYQLGVMMFANTILAVLYSFFFLSTILMACGPTYGCGQVINIITCKCVRTVGKKRRHVDGTELTEEEEEDEDWDPDSLVGQIEAEQRREEREAKVRLAQKKIDDHNRLQKRLVARKKAAKAKNKTSVLPVIPVEPTKVDEDSQEESGEI